MNGMSRRALLSSLPLAFSLPWLSTLKSAEGSSPTTLYPEFPAQNPERVKEMVGVSHGNIARVRELLAESPALAKAAWDWGFGDWETALGAASHMGNREIAAILIEHGARPDLFTFAMLGMIDVVKAYVNASSGIQRLKGPHGLTLMHHARQGGQQAEAVVAYLEQVGDADVRTASVALSDEEKQQYIGQFGIDGESTETLEVIVAKNSSLSIKKGKSGIARTIYYLGDHEFHPVGAEAVRIRFAMENGACSGLSILDGPQVFSAHRT